MEQHGIKRMYAMLVGIHFGELEIPHSTHFDPVGPSYIQTLCMCICMCTSTASSLQNFANVEHCFLMPCSLPSLAAGSGAVPLMGSL